jgi:hypothetical protein
MRIYKDLEGGGRLVVEGAIPILTYRDDETHKKRRDSQYLSRGSNKGPPEYKLRMLPLHYPA